MDKKKRVGFEVQSPVHAHSTTGNRIQSLGFFLFYFPTVSSFHEGSERITAYCFISYCISSGDRNLCGRSKASTVMMIHMAVSIIQFMKTNKTKQNKTRETKTEEISYMHAYTHEIFIERILLNSQNWIHHMWEEPESWLHLSQPRLYIKTIYLRDFFHWVLGKKPWSYEGIRSKDEPWCRND